MISIAVAKNLALSLPEAEEQDHMERPSYRIKKKIFAVLHANEHIMVVKLTPIDQSVFTAFDTDIIYPVSGGWGKQGWTKINLKKVKKGMFTDALTTAWKTVAPQKLVLQYFGE